jgi:hypothetical protein
MAASRTGSAGSGLVTIAASWEGAVYTHLFVKDGKDWARVELRPWYGAGTNRTLFEGPVSGEPAEIGGDHEIRD